MLGAIKKRLSLTQSGQPRQKWVVGIIQGNQVTKRKKQFIYFFHTKVHKILLKTIYFCIEKQNIYFIYKVFYE